MTDFNEKIKSHPLFADHATMGILSGENPYFQTAQAGHELLGHTLRNAGLQAEPREGMYGTPEKSWMVYEPTREEMYELGKKFGQESVIFSDGGRHELMYTNGPNAGKSRPSTGHEFFSEKPGDYYTHMPELGGYLRLNFDWDDSALQPSKLDRSRSIDAQQTRARHAQGTGTVAKAEILQILRQVLSKNNPDLSGVYEHPHSYPWHDPHTKHHPHVSGPGAILVKDEQNTPRPNPQPDGLGVSTYAKYAAPYGKTDPSQPSNLFHYPLAGKAHEVEGLVKQHGHKVYYAGGKFGRPDLANRNYDTKQLMIYDPSLGSNGDSGVEEYVDNWRKLHELAHALTLPEIDAKYGEGRRTGALGEHRTLSEAQRAVHWEWLACHKQRDLAAGLGIHIPDHVFHQELNTVMHDSLHRAVTGKFTEPSTEGFRPYSHKVPVEYALGMLKETAHNLGMAGKQDLIRPSVTKKSEGNTMSDEKLYDLGDVKLAIAKSLRDRVDAYSQELLKMRQRELKKNAETLAMSDHAAPINMKPADLCLTCGKADRPDSCVCLSKEEMFGQAEKPMAKEGIGGPAFGQSEKNPVKKDDSGYNAEMSLAEKKPQHECDHCGENHPTEGHNEAVLFGPEPKLLHPSDKKGKGKNLKKEDLAGLADGGAGAGAVPMAAAEMAKSEGCKDCDSKAHDLLHQHRARALDDESDRKAVSSSLAPHVHDAHKLVNDHSGKALDDEGDYRSFHGAVSAAMHDKHKPVKKASSEEKCGHCNGVHDGTCETEKKWHADNKAATKAGKKGVPVRPGDGVAKGEFKGKAKEPVKPAKGNGVKVEKLRSLAKVAMSGMAKMPKDAMMQASHDASKAGSAAPKATGAAIKLPGQAAHAARAQSMSDFMPAGKFTAAGSALPGSKPASPPTPPGGVPKAASAGLGPAKPAAPMSAGGGFPKASAAAPAGPKPASPPSPKQPKPALAAKNLKETTDLKKTLGECVFCGKTEHKGACV